MKKIHFLALAFILTSLSAFSAEPTHVRVALDWKPEPEFGGFYAAQKAGFYKQNGLDAEIIPGGAGQPVVQMVAAGRVEFGISSADEVIIARARGADVVALFSVYQTYPMGIMVHASKKIKTLGDVFSSGMTVSMEEGTPYAQFLKNKYGFTKSKIVPYTGGIATFLHDTNFAQQCFVTSEPVAAKHEKSDPQTFMVAESGYNPYTTVVVTRGDYLNKNRATVQKFMKSIRDGWTSYLKDPSAANALMNQLNPSMDLATFAEVAETQKPLIDDKYTRARGLGSMTIDRWATMGKQLVDLKLIDKPINYLQCFTKM